MKKGLLLLTAILGLFVFTACDNDNEVDPTEATEVTTVAAEPTTAGETEAVTEPATEEDGLTESDFVGTWIWDFSTDFQLILEADGTGDWVGHHGEIEWAFVNGELRITTSLMIERWNPVIEGDTLTISSLQEDDLEYIYIRQ